VTGIPSVVEPGDAAWLTTRQNLDLTRTFKKEKMTTDAGKELVERYLLAYKSMDLKGMEACMDPEFTFSDPAFPLLDGVWYILS
jgi:hypothetical protein